VKLIVIGNGMVGQRLLERLQANASDLETTVLCEESQKKEGENRKKR